MPTLQANATINLIAAGATKAKGTVSWEIPTIPPGNQIDSIVISGSWLWNGKGKINTVTIAGLNAAQSFDLTLPTSSFPPIEITCIGNKNATGDNFSWNNIIITYTYSKILYTLSFDDVLNGKISSDKNTYYYGDIITLSNISDSNYKLKYYIIDDTPIEGNSFIANNNHKIGALFTPLISLYIKNKNGEITKIKSIYKKIDNQIILVEHQNLIPEFNENINYLIIEKE